MRKSVSEAVPDAVPYASTTVSPDCIRPFCLPSSRAYANLDEGREW